MMKLLLGLALTATLAAAYFAPRPDDETVVVPAKIAKSVENASAHESLPVPASRAGEGAGFAAADLNIVPRDGNGDADLGNVFAGHAWAATVTAPTAALVLPPKGMKGTKPLIATGDAPRALPFQFLGRFIDDGKAAYFFQYNNRNIVLHPGDKVDENYVFESANAGTLTFAHLPLKQKQTLVVGEVN